MKPYTATTVLIERLTSEEYEENDYGGLPELIESIKLQDSGPTEASRAIRKKLKYGNVHRQLRALFLLDALISNAGTRFQRTFADEPLLERLRIAATDPTTDPDVRQRLRILFLQWAREYKGQPGLISIANLHQQFPRKARPVAPKPPVATITKPAPSPPPAAEPRSPVSPISPSSSTASAERPSGERGGWLNTHRKTKSKTPAPFNLEKEKPALNQALANASIASTNLRNALKLLNREKERPSEKRDIVALLDRCKILRTAILRYIQHVESEAWLGSLINAHEELGTAIDMFAAYDKDIEEDSDSDAEWNSDEGGGRKEGAGGIEGRMRGLSLAGGDNGAQAAPPMPPRLAKGKAPEPPVTPPVEEEDPDDPFGNRYEIEEDSGTGMRWREV